MDVKSLDGRLEIKDADKGEVDVVFSTLDVKDSDGDVTRKGAFQDGAPVRISAYQHMSWQGALPVGKGAIREVKNEAIMSGQFFMDTAAGRETFSVVKALGDLQEWSYGYDPVEFSFGEHQGEQVRFLEKLKVHEVSPVLLGAGVGTRTINAKSLKFVDEGQAVVAAMKCFVDRAADVMAMRAEKGKGISPESVELLRQIKEQSDRLQELLTQPDPSAEHKRELERILLSSIRQVA